MNTTAFLCSFVWLQLAGVFDFFVCLLLFSLQCSILLVLEGFIISSLCFLVFGFVSFYEREKREHIIKLAGREVRKNWGGEVILNENNFFN